MASPTLNPLPGAHAAELIPIPFRATLDGANDAVIVRGKKAIASIKRTGAGTFTITLQEGYVALVAAMVQLFCPTVASLHVQVNSEVITTGSGGTVLLTIVKPTAAGNTALVATDPPAANANACELHGVLWVENLSLTA